MACSTACAGAEGLSGSTGECIRSSQECTDSRDRESDVRLLCEVDGLLEHRNGLGEVPLTQ